MRWSVYKIGRQSRLPTITALGYVNAANQPHAVEAAKKRWPKEADEMQSQHGFSVRDYKRDPYSLGKRYASSRRPSFRVTT